jgi:hypothetical protein
MTMGIQKTSDDQGFQFPGVFEITAMGPAEAGLDQTVPVLLVEAGLVVLHETLRVRASSAGRYLSVAVSFRAETRPDYEAAHRVLRAHPDVKWTL